MTLNLRYNYKQVSIERKNIMSEQTELLERPYINIVNVIWSFDRETNQVNMLLVKRANEPEKGAWAMPETYLRTEESADAAALRLVREKNRTESVCDPYRTVGDFHESDAFRPGARSNPVFGVHDVSS